MIHEESKVIIAAYEWFCLKYPQYKKCWLRVEVGGKRSKPEAGFLKREGQQPGTADLLLAIQAGSFSGLWLEQKTLDGPLKPHQREFLLLMAERGFAVAVAFGLDAAMKIVDAYIEGQHDQIQMLEYLNKKTPNKPFTLVT